MRRNEKSVFYYKMLLKVNNAFAKQASKDEYQPHVYRYVALYNRKCPLIGCAKDGYFLIKTKFLVLARAMRD